MISTAERLEIAKEGIRIHHIWESMAERCTSSSSTAFKNYGGRGITVCQEWLDSFDEFYSWAIQNGYSADLSIDRIDVNGNYEPGNCRWATDKEQGNNKRNTLRVDWMDGNTYTLMELYDKFCPDKSIHPNTIRNRIFRFGWKQEWVFSKRPRTIKSDILVDFKGETAPLKDVVKKYSTLHHNIVRHRIGLGWSVEDAISVPARKSTSKSNITYIGLRAYITTNEGLQLLSEAVQEYKSFHPDCIIDSRTVLKRLNRGWSLFEALEAPKQKIRGSRK